MMMNSKKSSRFGLARYGFIAPIIIALLLVFGTTKAAFLKSTINKVQTVADAAIKDLGLVQPDTQQTANIPPSAIADERHAEKITLHQAVLNTEAPAIVTDTPKIKIIPKPSSMGNDSVLYILDGEPITSKADFQKINMSEIESIDILKNTDAVKLFGDSGYKGAVIMISKNATNYESIKKIVQKIKEIRVTNGQKAFDTKTTGVATVRVNPDRTDTSVTSALKNSSVIHELVKKRDSIDKSIQGLVRNEVSAANKERIKDVVVVGYGTKKNANITIKGKSGQPEPLWIVDGKEMLFSPLNELKADSIETISVLKDASATALYGAKAINGVVIITTKKAVKNPLRKTD